MTEEKKENGMINYSISLKESYWEEIKQDPTKLGEIVTRVIDSIDKVDDFAKQGRSRSVCTDFRFVERTDMDRLLELQFEVYDVADEEEEKKYLEKLDPETRKIYESVKNDK